LIIASGIREVQYLQPYYKSLVRELYEDSVAIDEELKGKVKFHPFVGVTPNGYRLVFEKGRRKEDNGDAVRWIPSEGYPVFTTGYPSYLNTEANMLLGLEDIKNKMEAKHNPLGLARNRSKPAKKAATKKKK
jgi:hypothetical protein